MKQDKDEKMMVKYKGSPLSTLFRCQYPPWMFLANGATLIPRNATRIMVYGIWDIRMNVQRDEVHRTPMRQPSDQTGHDRVLHEAARRGDLNAVREVVARGSGAKLVSSMDSQGNLPLHLAVDKGHKEVAFYLVDKYPKGSYVSNRQKKSPLYLAVESSHTDLVDYMLRACVNDANLVTVLNQAQPIVHVAIYRQNLEMVKTILKHQPGLIKSSKDEEGRTPLSYAASKGHLNIVQHLLEAFPTSISYKNNDQDGSFPVHKACLGGHVDVLKIFHSISSKSLFQEDNHGYNILHLAAKERGNKLKDVVSYLLSLPTSSNTSRKSFNKEDECGYKPLALAQRNKNNEVAQLLIAAGMH